VRDNPYSHGAVVDNAPISTLTRSADLTPSDRSNDCAASMSGQLCCTGDVADTSRCELINCWTTACSFSLSAVQLLISYILTTSYFTLSRGPGLAGTRMSPFWTLIELNVMELVVTTGAIRHAKLRSNCYHRQTNTQFFYRPDALPVTQQTVSETEQKLPVSLLAA